MTRHYSDWRKSCHSDPDADCVEVGRSATRTIGVRDTKDNGTGPTLEFTRTALAAFTRRLRDHT